MTERAFKAMRRAAILVALATIPVYAQTTTCSSSGSSVTCTTMPSWYQIGQQFGNAIGQGVNAATSYDTFPDNKVNWKSVKKRCKKYPGTEWVVNNHSGRRLVDGYCNLDGSYTVNR